MIRAADCPAVGYRTRNIKCAGMIGSCRSCQVTRGINRNRGDWSHSMLAEDAPAASKHHKVSCIAEPVHLPRMASLADSADVCSEYSESSKNCTPLSMLNICWRSFTLLRWHTLKVPKTEWATCRSTLNVQKPISMRLLLRFGKGPGGGSGSPLGVSKIKWAKPSCSLESFTSRSPRLPHAPSESPTPLKWDSVFKTLSKYGIIVIISNDRFTTAEAFKTLPKKLSFW